MIGHELVFNRMEIVSLGHTLGYRRYDGNAKAKLVVYMDSTQCQICRLNNIYRYIPYMEMDVQNDEFDFIIVLSPLKRNYNDIKHTLAAQKVVKEIYIDDNGDFIRNNPFISENPRFHTFLLDADNKIELIGDPTASEKIAEMLNYRIAELLK